MKSYQLAQHLWQWGSGGMLAALCKETLSRAGASFSCLLWFGLLAPILSHKICFPPKGCCISVGKCLLSIGAISIYLILFQNKEDSWGKRPLKLYSVMSCHHYEKKPRYCCIFYCSKIKITKNKRKGQAWPKCIISLRLSDSFKILKNQKTLLKCKYLKRFCLIFK